MDELDGGDGRTNVWVKDALVANALSSPVKPLAKRRLPSASPSPSTPSAPTGGVSSCYSPGRNRLNGKKAPLGSSKKIKNGKAPMGMATTSSVASAGWGWTRAFIVSTAIAHSTGASGCALEDKQFSSPGYNRTPSTPNSASGAGGFVVLVIADRESEHDGRTIKLSSAEATHGMVMANTFTSSASTEERDLNSPDSRGSDKENDSYSRSTGRGGLSSSSSALGSLSSNSGRTGADGGSSGGRNLQLGNHITSPPSTNRRRSNGGALVDHSSMKKVSGNGASGLAGASLPPDDLITLTHLHEPAVVYCLRRRYAVDKIYTSTGPILLALNPFKDCGSVSGGMGLYGEDVMRHYWERGEANSGSRGIFGGTGGGSGGFKTPKKSHDKYATPTKTKSFGRSMSAGKRHNRNANVGSGDDVEDKVAMRNSMLPPHAYAVADNAFRSMMRNLEDSSAGIDLIVTPGKQTASGSMEVGDESILSADQSILVSGESGAGKTVTTKIIMSYLAVLSRRSVAAAVNRHVSAKLSSPPPSSNKKGFPAEQQQQLPSPSPPPSPSETKNIEQQVLESNPILESFGNARTIRNDNSSRFGKFIELQFTMKGNLVGAHIDTYLLEKVRLLSQAKGERNYHIFYEILGGASQSILETFFVDGTVPEDFRMTSSSGTYGRRDGVKDEDTFKDLIHAMDTMGFTRDEQQSCLSTACALLHASNLTFQEITADESRLDMNNPSLPAALSLLGVSAEDLDRALCFCAMDICAAGESLTKTLSVERATKALEALMKATYGAMFEFLVQRINNLIACKNKDQRRGGKAAFIGVLDIFGFESFDMNSFEQLCINYCNEGLQQQFNRFVFKLEQQEYEREGISWSFISFPDNQDVLDLIDAKRTGIIPILDDLCLLSKNTDESFATALQKKCSSHPRFQTTRKQIAQGFFSINHYAGVVEYSTRDFLEKNKDELPREATELLLGSSDQFIQLMGYVLSKPQKQKGEGKQTPSDKGTNSTPVLRRSKSSLVRASVGAQFCSQLRSLRERIDCTSPHYVRCLKPNDDLVPDKYDPGVVVDQLRCCGILEAVRVSRVGYPHRYEHHHFVERYRCIAWKKLHQLSRRNGRRSSKAECELLIDNIVSQIEMIESSPSEGEEFKTTSSGRFCISGVMKSKDKTSSDDLVTVGLQMGKTKVFLRRPVFDVIEGFRGQINASAATKMASVVRMFLVRVNIFRIIPEFLGEGYATESENEPSNHSRPPPPKRELSSWATSFEASLAIATRNSSFTPTCTSRKEEKPRKWVCVNGRWVKNEILS